jgi:hypothetical protein
MQNSNKYTEYLDKVVEEKGSFSVSWDGGGDDGCYTVHHGDETVDHYSVKNEIVKDIVEKVHYRLGYGSFAGNYYCQGRVDYDPETKCLVGDDNYSEEEYNTMSIEKNPIRINVPEELWFVSMDVTTDCDYHATVNFLIEGPVHELHESTEKITRKKLMKELEKRVVGKQVGTAYGEYLFRFDEFKIDKKNKVRYVEIKEIETQETNEQNTSILIDFSEE